MSSILFTPIRSNYKFVDAHETSLAWYSQGFRLITHYCLFVRNILLKSTNLYLETCIQISLCFRRACTHSMYMCVMCVHASSLSCTNEKIFYIPVKLLSCAESNGAEINSRFNPLGQNLVESSRYRVMYVLFAAKGFSSNEGITPIHWTVGN